LNCPDPLYRACALISVLLRILKKHVARDHVQELKSAGKSAEEIAATSMSRNLVSSALLPREPCPGTILVLLSAKDRVFLAGFEKEEYFSQPQKKESPRQTCR